MNVSPQDSVNWGLGYIFTLNSIIGTGILLVPWAVSQSGVLLSTILELAVCLYSVLVSYQVLQTWSRIEIIVKLRESNITVRPVPLRDIFFNTKGNYIEKAEGQTLLDENDLKPQISSRQLDFYEITKLILGESLGKVMGGLLIIQLIPILIAESSVFASSLASNVSLFGKETCNIYDQTEFYSDCRVIYWSYLSVFGAFMIFLCFFHIKEQKWLQVLAFVFRFLFFFLIFLTCIIALASNSELEEDSEINADPDLFNIYKIGYIIPVVCLVTFNQNTLSTTTAFIKDRSSNVTKVINTTMLTVFILEAGIGLFANYSIESIEKMVSLNWRDYSAGEDPSQKSQWCYVVVYTVVLLPAVVVSSIFPILCSNLCDNILSFEYGYDSKEDLKSAGDKQKAYVICKLCITTLVMIIAFVEHDIAIFLDLAGCLCIITNGMFVPVFCMAASHIIPAKTQFDFKYNYQISIASIFIAGFVLIISIISIFTNI